MVDRMHPTPIADLIRWVFAELDARRSIFGLPEALFFRPRDDDPFTTRHCGRALESPIGVAAGPHTQLAQNITCAYLAGARFIELKTVQTLDRLDVAKPCIDMEDVGYNCEWSQELTLSQSFGEYLNAWILLHAVRSRLGWQPRAEDPGFAFNMSVGYNLQGIRAGNVQGFLRKMRNAAERKRALVSAAASAHPPVAGLDLADRLSDSVTLSTMHGCRPDEIERIGRHLIEDLGLHTAVKLNPTLLGPERLREILHGDLGFDDIEVPDEAFEHDPRIEDAVDIIRSLQRVARQNGLCFWIKLTNTLETRNRRQVLPVSESVHYMSGRALHPLCVSLAAELTERFAGQLPVSLSGGADAFNLPELVACRLSPVTVCSDLLKPGGYGRQAQYLEHLGERMRAAGASSPDDFACRRALGDADRCERAFAALAERTRRQLGLDWGPNRWAALREDVASHSGRSAIEGLRLAADRRGLDAGQVEALVALFIQTCAQQNLSDYAQQTRRAERYRKARRRPTGKTSLPLGAFDCISAPCREGCPADQNVPDTMYLVARGRTAEAMQVVLQDNPLPSTTGAVCDHPCASKCVRSHYDRPLAIREIKRFLTERVADWPRSSPAPDNGIRVALVGAGPAGLAGAAYLALAGFRVTVYDAQDEPGGVPARMIPAFRLPKTSLAADVEHVRALGVAFRFSTRVGTDVSFERVRKAHRYVFIGTGAQRGARLRIEGEGAEGVLDALDFLTAVRSGCAVELGRRVLVVGGGNSAVDAARTAWRLVGTEGTVTLVYRRGAAQMPADDEALEALSAEGVRLRELHSPKRVVVDAADRVVGLECLQTELGPADESGRPRPMAVAGSETVLPADAVVVAVGQKPQADWLQGTGVALTGWDAVAIDPATGETSLPGVFAGGDAVRGGGSIAQAMADARRAVREILRREGLPRLTEPKLDKRVSLHDHLVRRARRTDPADLPQRAPDERRRDFEPRLLSLSEAQALSEARRCLGCDELCALCVTVCPNRANLVYQSRAFQARLARYEVTRGALRATGAAWTFRVEQAAQIVHLADWCNECGNCETFCPRQGAPFRHKPRLCLSEESFAEEPEAFRLWATDDGWCAERKEPRGLHRLACIGDDLRYAAPVLCAELDATDFGLRSLEPGPQAREGDRADLSVCATLCVLARGLFGDSTFLPGLR